MCSDITSGVRARSLRWLPSLVWIAYSACVFPTDRSDEQQVQFLDTIPAVFIEDDTVSLLARVVDMDGAAVPGQEPQRSLRALRSITGEGGVFSQLARGLQPIGIGTKLAVTPATPSGPEPQQ